MPRRDPSEITTPAPPDVLPWVGNSQEYGWLRGIVASILILNGIDAVLTTLWVDGGLANEANPFLGDLVATQPVLFVAIKVVLVSFGSWTLWRRRREPLAVVGIFGVFLVYYWLLLVHVRAFHIAVIDELLARSGMR